MQTTKTVNKASKKSNLLKYDFPQTVIRPISESLKKMLDESLSAFEKSPKGKTLKQIYRELNINYEKI